MTVTRSKIEWTDSTWSPVTGCTSVSPGCDNCYARTMTERFHGPGSFDQVQLHEDRLSAPLRWRKPRRVFVNSMSDLFHRDVPDEFIARVWAVMAATPQHTYQVLTKRHGRMRSVLASPNFRREVNGRYGWLIDPDGTDLVPDRPWPLSNVWLGVSVEDQRAAELRIPALLDTSGAVRFVSCEPLLSGVDLSRWLLGPRRIDWVIVGGESGHGARRCDPSWIRSLVEQGRASGVPVFVKQLGSVWGQANGWGGKGGLPEQWPEDLRVREFPVVARG